MSGIWRLSGRITGGIISFLSIIAVIVSAQAVAASQPTVSWLDASSLKLTKVADLPGGTQPVAYGIDCQPVDFLTGPNNDQTPKLHGCAITTAIGTIANGYILNGTHGTLPLNKFYTPTNGMVVSSPPGMLDTILTERPAKAYGAVYFLASTYNAAGFQYASYSSVHQYEYAPLNPQILRDSKGQAVSFLPYSLAYSANGEWMAAVALDGRIIRYDTATWHSKNIGWENKFISSETAGTNLAISNDGQYIALNASTTAYPNLTPSLKVYDATTCDDLTGHAQNDAGVQPCEHKDTWSMVSGGAAGLEYPLHIRFVDDSTLSLQSIHDRASADGFQTSSYQLSTTPAVQTPAHDMNLLALGDSYISGEGTYAYEAGTDTSSNKCHNSLLSYPYLLGKTLGLENYNSVACSGATTEDVASTSANYMNQQIPKVPQNTISASEKANILNDFMPGNITQLQFVETKHPGDVLLSVGGNDIHFSDIVKLCVLSTGDDSCFDSAAERKALLQYIYDQHNVLVDTYTQILTADPGAQLYVVGYPQIANPNGNCGLNVHLDTDELKFGSLLITRLNQTIQHAAEAAGARYVDVEQAFAGHMLCDAGVKAVNGLTAGNDSLLNQLGNESYHPTAYGHTLLAKAISQQTSGLTEPMSAATGAGKPTVNDSDSFITGANGAGVLRKLIFGTFESANVLFRTMRFQFDTKTLGISPSTAFTIVFHSKEVRVASGIVPKSGVIDMDIAVPKLAPGAHTIHLYTQDSSGENLDITQVVYVAASQTDYDGDGIPNTVDSCPLVKNTGLDTDGDGVDDACDGDTAAVAAPASTAQDSEQKTTNTTSAPGPSEMQTIASTSSSAVAQSAAPEVLAGKTTKTDKANNEPKQTPDNKWWVVFTAGPILLLAAVLFTVFGVRRSE